MAICKDDDELYVEVVELDATLGRDMVARGQDVINARVPPPRIASRPDYVTCKMCDHVRQCFYDAAPEINCRSCIHAWPVEGGAWGCDAHNTLIPAEIIPVGCHLYKRIA